MGNDKHLFSFYIRKDQHDALRLAATEHDTSMGSIIRELISEWMEREPETEK